MAPAPMTKAYDLKVLLKRLSENGLDVAEEQAAKAWIVLKDWAKESAVISATPYDNLVVPFIDQLDGVVLPQIDKISPNVKTGK